LKWFRKWKEQGESDWVAYKKCLSFPLTPARAKGLAPFNAASRLLAGLDEEFIRNLEVCEHSRGRTPVVHWFNPNAESHARSHLTGLPWQPDKISLALEADLECLILGCCRKDDAALLRKHPSVEHLARLKRAGFEIPEILTTETLPGRKLGGMRPWAWSPDASAMLKPHAAAVSPTMDQPWREPLPAHWFSKEIGLLLEKEIGPVAETGQLLGDEAAIMAEAARLLEMGQVLFKAPFSHAGRGHLRVNHQSDEQKTRGWVRNTLAAHRGVVVELWLDRVLDFSALYEMHADGRVAMLGLTHMENDAAGRFLGIRVGPKWGSVLDGELAAFVYGRSGMMRIYQEIMPAKLSSLLPGYVGPLCVDALIHRRPDASLALKPVVELNVRTTMGRIAWEWMRRQPKASAGRLRILRRAAISDEELIRMADGPGLFLNDQTSATTFLAWWESC